MQAHEIISAMYDAQPLVIGHRGAKAYAPMNTLPAFELAADQGAHGIELDVHRSADGHPVILHDFTVDGTTNGSGDVRSLTLAQLKALDAGSYFAEAFRGVQVPTLDEVFEAVGRRLFINVEIKSESEETDGVEQVVADCIKRHDMLRRVLVSSFNPLALQRFRAILPDVPIGYLVMPDYMTQYAAVMASTAYEAYHPYHEMLDAQMVADEHAAGRRLNTWTVNDPARAVALAAMGVDGIVTDNPDTVLAALNA